MARIIHLLQCGLLLYTAGITYVVASGKSCFVYFDVTR